MSDAKQACPECGYPSPLPTATCCTECGKTLRVVLAGGVSEDATRRFAILYFLATGAPLVAEVVRSILVLWHYAQPFRSAGLGLQIYVVCLYAALLVCAVMAIAGFVLSVRFRPPRLQTQRRLRRLALIVLVGTLWFFAISRILDML